MKKKHSIKNLYLLLFLLGFFFQIPFSGNAQVGAEFYVSESGGGDYSGNDWGNAMSNAAFSQALLSAQAGAVFYVKAGTYYPSADRDGNTAAEEKTKTFVLHAGVKIFGSYKPELIGTAKEESDRNWQSIAELTVPTTVFDGNDNKEHVWTILSGDGITEVTTVLDGIRVTRGFHNAEVEAGGSGIYAILGMTDHLKIINCKIDNNKAQINLPFISGGANDNKGRIYAAGLYISGTSPEQLGKSLEIKNTIIAQNRTTDHSERRAGNPFAGGGGPWGVNIFGAGAFITRIANSSIDKVDIYGNIVDGFGTWGGITTGAYNATLGGTLYLKSYAMGSGMIIYNSGPAEISHARVYNNEVHGSVAGSAGIGIGANDNFPVKNASSLGVPQRYRISHSTFYNNFLEGRFAGMGAGFGVATDGTGEVGRLKDNTAIVEIDNVTASGNSINVNAVKSVMGLTPQNFSSGGGFYTAGATVTISNSTFSRNKAKNGVVNSKKSTEFTQYLPIEQQKGLFYAPDNSDITLNNVLITDNIKHYLESNDGGDITFWVDSLADESLNLYSDFFGMLANKKNQAEIKYAIVGNKYFENPGVLSATGTQAEQNAAAQAYVNAAPSLFRYIDRDSSRLILPLAQNNGAHTQTHALAEPCAPALYKGNPAFAGSLSQNGILRATPVAIGSWETNNPKTEPSIPVAQDDAGTTTVNKPVIIPVLTNDAFNCDPWITIKTGPTHGTASVNGNHEIVYTPERWYTGSDVLVYNLNTPFGNSEATVNITINCNPLNGDHYVNADGSKDFQTLKEAADIYNFCGIAGDSRLIIESNLIDTATVEFLGSASGSTEYTLLITADNTQRIVSGNINGALVKFTGANNITIDGGVAANASAIDGGTNNTTLMFFNTNKTTEAKVLLVTKEGTSDGSEIYIKNASFFTDTLLSKGSAGIAIEAVSSVKEVSGCYFTKVASGINMSNIFSGNFSKNVIRHVGRYGIYDTTTIAGVMNMQINENNIRGIYLDSAITDASSSKPAYAVGIAVFSRSGTGNICAKNNMLQGINNAAKGNADQIYSCGIWIEFAGNDSISGNHISHLRNTNGSYVRGIVPRSFGTGTIDVRNCVVRDLYGRAQVMAICLQRWANTTGWFIAEHNEIDSIESAGTAGNQYAVGIGCWGVKGKILANTIHNMLSKNYHAIGIQAQADADCHVLSDVNETTLVANNMIHSMKAKFAYGISCEMSIPDLKVIHNTINLIDNNITDSWTVNISYRINSTVNHFAFKNNMLVNKNNDPYACYLIYDNTSYVSFDAFTNANHPVFADNRYSCQGGDIARIYIQTSGGGSRVYSDMPSWNAVSGDNSAIGNPVFVGETDLHLTPTSLADMNLLVPFIPEVPLDFDDEGRSACGNVAGADRDPNIGFVLHGDYIVNADGSGDFISLKQAADIYNTCGLDAETKFIISADLYETDTVEFLGTAPGSTEYPLLITTDGNQRTVSGNIAGPLVLFTGANRITIDGGIAADTAIINAGNNNTNLIFHNTNTVSPVALQIRKAGSQSGKDMYVRNATFSTATKNNNSYGILIASDSVKMVEGCYVHDATFGIYNHTVKAGYMKNNIIRDVKLAGLSFESSATLAGVDYKIIGNDIRRMLNPDVDATTDGIRINNSNGNNVPANYSTGTIWIENNMVDDIQCTKTGSGYANRSVRGLRLNFGGTLTAKGNRVSNLILQSGSYVHGILANAFSNGSQVFIDHCTVSNIHGEDHVIAIYPQSRTVTSSYDVRACLVDGVVSEGGLGGTYAQAIGISGDGNGTIWGNTVRNIENKRESAFAIFHQNVSTQGRALIANNMVDGGLVAASDPSKMAVGVYITAGSGKTANAGIFHNTIRLGDKLGAYHQACFEYASVFDPATTIRNNIFMNEDASANNGNSYVIYTISTGYPIFSDNLFHPSNGKISFDGNGTETTDIDDWKTMVSDNSSSKIYQPSFVDQSNDLHLAGTSLTDANLKVPFLTGVVETDFDGDARSVHQNAAGADNNTPVVELALTVFLQGPMVATKKMSHYIQLSDENNSLFSSPKLPVINSCHVAGVSYSAINDTNGVAGKVVDWIKVEIREAADPSNVLETKALLLKPDGNVVDTNGQWPVFTKQDMPVLIAVSHRNHLSMVSQSVSPFRGTVPYDFSTGVDKALADAAFDPMVEKNGTWCMWAGDLNFDHVIENLDRSILLNTNGLYDEYLFGDVNMDGVIDNLDRSIVIIQSKMGLYSPLF